MTAVTIILAVIIIALLFVIKTLAKWYRDATAFIETLEDRLEDYRDEILELRHNR